MEISPQSQVRATRTCVGWFIAPVITINPIFDPWTAEHCAIPAVIEMGGPSSTLEWRFTFYGIARSSIDPLHMFRLQLKSNLRDASCSPSSFIPLSDCRSPQMHWPPNLEWSSGRASINGGKGWEERNCRHWTESQITNWGGFISWTVFPGQSIQWLICWPNNRHFVWYSDCDLITTLRDWHVPLYNLI